VKRRRTVAEPLTPEKARVGMRVIALERDPPSPVPTEVPTWVRLEPGKEYVLREIRKVGTYVSVRVEGSVKAWSIERFAEAPRMEDEFVAAAEHYENLGPAYFKGRAVAERAMANFQIEHFEPILEKFTTEFRDRLWEKMQGSFLMDAELGIQTEIWNTVDGTVRALLSGETWALARYALGSRYDQEAVRAAIAKHIPAELQDKRIQDLESKVQSLTESLERERRYR
jgi:acylphosphatase